MKEKQVIYAYIIEAERNQFTINLTRFFWMILITMISISHKPSYSLKENAQQTKIILN